MTDSRKTGLFLGATILAAGAAWFTSRPPVVEEITEIKEMVGQDLFPNFDPLSAASLKIVRFDEGLAELKSFEVAKDSSGVWTIPSHDGYPADAAEQMSEAANTFTNLKALDVVSVQRDDQSLFGVVEPDVEKLKITDQGVGTLVRLQDEQGSDLVNLVIGKTDKDDPTQRFVRVPNSDAIYVVKLDDSNLSTQFTRWIEEDLLKLSSTDIEKIGLRDYSILQTQTGGEMTRNFDADLRYDLTDNEWSPERLVQYDQGQAVPRSLADGEELNEIKINEIKRTLDSLRIVDVKRKPTGLAANLKAEKLLLDNNESVMSLFRKGFIPQPSEDGSSDILATSGELLVTQNDGVQYVLRFGNSSGESESDDALENESEDGDSEDGDSESQENAGEDDEGVDSLVNLDRYLLVTVRLDESKFPSPILSPLPETLEEWEAMQAPVQQPEVTGETMEESGFTLSPDTEAGSEESTDENTESTDSAGTNEAGDDTSMPNEESSQPIEGGTEEPAKMDSEPPTAENSTSGGEEPPSPAEPSPPSDPESSGNAPPNNDQSNAGDGKLIAFQEPVAEQEESDTNADSGDADVQPKQETEEERRERLEAIREQITKENQRLIDSRNEDMEKARRRVAELNARFADWFFEISESEYKKLRCSLDDLIKSAANDGSTLTPPPPGGFGIPQP